MKLNWRPIAELKDKEDGNHLNLLLCAPELISPDFNPDGIAPGFWDGEEWKGAGFDMHNDEFTTITVNPTHFCYVGGPENADELVENDL